MNLEPAEIAAALGARVVAAGAPEAPIRATIDSGASGPGDLFFGLRGANRDGGEFAPAAIAAGVWGVVLREQVLSGHGGGDGPTADHPRRRRTESTGAARSSAPACTSISATAFTTASRSSIC